MIYLAVATVTSLLRKDFSLPDYSLSLQALCNVSNSITQPTDSLVLRLAQTYQSLFLKNPIVMQASAFFNTGNLSFYRQFNASQQVLRYLLSNFAPFLFLSINVSPPLLLLLLFLPLLLVFGLMRNSFRCCCSELDNESSACSVSWPTYLMLVIVILQFAAIGAGLYFSGSLIDQVVSAECNVLSSLQEAMTGTLDSNNTFHFAGSLGLRDRLQGLSALLPAIKAAMSNYSQKNSDLTVARNIFRANAENNLQGFTNPIYQGVFYNQAGTSVSVTSNIKSYLTPSHQSGTVYNLTSTLLQSAYSLSAKIFSVILQSKQFLNSKQQSSIKSSLSSIDNFLNLSTKVFNFTNAAAASPQQFNQSFKIYLYLAQAVSALLTLIFLMAVLGLYSFKIQKCRLCSVFTVLLYALSLIGLGCFICLFSVAFTGVSWSCQGYPVLFKNQTSLGTLFEFLGKENATFFSGFFVGRDLLRNSTFSTSLGPTLNIIEEGLTSVSSYKGVMQEGGKMTAQGTQNIFNKVNEIILNLMNNRVVDVSSSDAIQHLRKISSKGYSTANCIPNAESDSWVPNFNNSNFTCRTGVLPSLYNCSYLGTASCLSSCFAFTQNFGTRTNICPGLYNCTEFSGVPFSVTSRYGQPSQCLYSKYLIQLNTNWDDPRQFSLKGLNNSMFSVTTGSMWSITNFLGVVNSVNSEFNTLLELISKNKSILSQQFGVFNASNSKIWSQLLQSRLQVSCKRLKKEIFVHMWLMSLYIWLGTLSLLVSLLMINRKIDLSKQGSEISYSDVKIHVINK